MKLGSKTSSFLFAAVMAVASSASAQEPPPDGTTPQPTSPPPSASIPSTTGMGSQGQIVLAADLPVGTNAPFVTLAHTSRNMNAGSSDDITLAPSGDYFVAPNISVGGKILFSSAPFASALGGGGPDATTFGVLVRGGYSLNLTDVISVWARLSIGYMHMSIDGVAGGMSTTLSSIPLIVEAPVLWHPTSHFFIGAGPMLSTPLMAKSETGGTSTDTVKATTFGLTTMIGGYFGGA